METKRVELGDVFYVFTNWGLCKGKVIKIQENYVLGEETETGERLNVPVKQYQLNIDDYYGEGTEFNMKYGFWFTEDQLYENPKTALAVEADKWDVNVILSSKLF